MEESGDVFSDDYLKAKLEVEQLEHEIGEWTETIDYSDDKEYVVIPPDIYSSS